MVSCSVWSKIRLGEECVREFGSEGTHYGLDVGLGSDLVVVWVVSLLAYTY